MKELTALRFRGYCSQSNFGGFKIPIPIQNCYYREYCNVTHSIFLLSQNELLGSSVPIKLVAMSQSREDNGILLVSMKMLPDDFIMRLKIYKNVINSNRRLIFILEKLELEKSEDIAQLEKILKLESILGKNKFNFCAPDEIKLLKSTIMAN